MSLNTLHASRPLSPLQAAYARGGSERVAAEVARKLILRAAAGEKSPYAEGRSAVGTLKRPTTTKAEISRLFKNGPLFFWRPKLAVHLGKGGGGNRPQWAWSSLAVQMVYPELEQRRINAKIARPFAKILKDLSVIWTQKDVSQLAHVKKNDESFTITVPVMYIPDAYLPQLSQLFASRAGMDNPDPLAPVPLPQPNLDIIPSMGRPNPDAAQTDLSAVQAVQFRWMRPELLKNRGGMFPLNSLNKLRSLPGTMLGTMNYAGGIAFMLQLEFMKEDCEYLTMSNWMEIRPLDMYGLVRALSDTRMGQFGEPPRFAQNLPSIAASIPKNLRPRTSPEEILVDENNDYYWIPTEANGINDYESGMARELSQADGTFGTIDVVTGLTLKPPTSKLVLVDWANLKLAYSDNFGKLHVKGLDRALPTSPTHYRRLLEKKIAEEYGATLIKTIFNMAASVKVPAAVGRTGLKPDDIADLARDILAIGGDDYEGLEASDIGLVDVYRCSERVKWCGAFLDCCNHLVQLSGDEDNRSLLFREYSVLTALNAIAAARVISLKAGQYETLVAEDNESRKKYKTQDNIDPNFIPQEVPFMAKGRGVMPHQRRVLSRLATSAELVILPVHAGGGKTPICVYDVLKEFGNKTARRFLIMCPSHLVGQYVKEFVYFTEGRLNVIAVNSYTLNRHGIEGLARLLESSPPNTVVVTDYNIAMGEKRGFSTGYGTSLTKVFPVVEMLRSFNFDYVALDESHYLKGVTARQAAVSRLITEIPKKRLMSGTLAPNDIMDLVQQVALLDPTIFGSRSEFMNKYALEVRGTKVLAWRDGSAVDIMARLKDSVVWAPAKRKEWAAILPDLVEDAVEVNLTPAQQGIYNNLLNEVVEELKAQIAENKKFKSLQKFFTKQDTKEGEVEVVDETDEDVDDELEESALNSLLRPYLARLEMFVTAPAMDPLGGELLKGDDRISPKVHAVTDVCTAHLAAGTPGKILIFCNYTNSAQGIYDGFPPELRKQTILYSADRKEECGAQFETDASKNIMVGVETSMNTGLNLQFCSRLIRVDSVWTPGALEQGNSRIGRPNIKVKETRSKIYINWITANRTIDVTKMAYLFAKRISVGKFEEAGNPLYKNVGDPPLFKMTLETIAESNEQTGEMLSPYYQAYRDFKVAQFKDFADYRANHPEDMNENGIVMTPLAKAPNPPGSALMYRLPYVPGVELYKGEDLGLVRYDQLLKQDSDLLEPTEDDGDDEDDDPQDKKQGEINKAEYRRVGHLSVHCEYGDCEITGVSRKFLRVKDQNGERHTISKLTAFIITRAQTSGKDMRSLLLKQVGDVPFDAPVKIEVPASDRKLPKKGSTAPDVPPEDNTPRVQLEIVVLNDFLGLEMNDVSTNPAGARALEAIGFKTPAPYAYAEIPTAQHMYNQFKKWSERGFYFSKNYNASCQALYIALKNARKNAVNFVGLASTVQLQNFFRMHIKPVSDPLMLCPYPMVKDNKIYLCLPLHGHPASQKAMSVRVGGVTWAKANVNETLSVFMPSLASLDKNMRGLLSTGIEVTNIKTLKTRREHLQRRNPALLKGLQS